jgi:hypothetical protein
MAIPITPGAGGFMSVWQIPAALRGSEGELVSVHIRVEPRHLEDLLEALAEVPFPINPQIHHHVAGATGADRKLTLVEFPAYAARIAEAERVLRSHGFHDCTKVVSMLEEIQSH